MPTVPAPHQQVGLEPLPNARVAVDAPIEAFGGGAANPRLDLSELANQAHDIFQQEKQRADETAVVAAAAKASDLETRLTISTRQRLGTDAFSAPEQVTEDWDKSTQEIESGLTNDTQRAAFERVKASHWNSLNSAVQSHVADQRQKYDAQVTDDAIGAERNAAIVNFDNPGRVALSIANQVAAIKTHLEKVYNGQIPEGLLERATLEASSSTQTAVIDRLLANGQDLAAKTYYSAVKDQISGADSTKIEKALEVGSKRGESQRQADAILAKPDIDEQTAVQQARAIKDPDVRDDVEERIRREFTERAQQQRAVRDATFQRASDQLERARGDVNRINPSDWAGLTLQERSALRAYGKQLTEGTPTKTDLGTYYSLRTMAVTPETRDKFLKRNLMLDRPYLSEGDFKQMVDLQADLKKGDQASENKLHAIRTNDQIVNDALEGIGLGVVPSKREKDKPIIDTIKRSIDAAVELEQSRTGKPASSADVQRITDQILTQHVVSTPGWLWGTNQENKRLFELGPNDQLVLTVKDIPKPDRDALTARLRKAGLPVTDESLVSHYKAYVGGLVRRGPQ